LGKSRRRVAARYRMPIGIATVCGNRVLPSEAKDWTKTLYGTEGGFTKRTFRHSGDGTRGQPAGFRSAPGLDKSDLPARGTLPFRSCRSSWQAVPTILPLAARHPRGHSTTIAL
jgi:hypothetical protein